jgi:hypothetical protein
MVRSVRPLLGRASGGAPGSLARERRGPLRQRLSENLLFPVDDTVSGDGASLRYHLVGFAGFNLQSYSFQGGGGTIEGSFTMVDWAGTGTATRRPVSVRRRPGSTASRLLG